MSSVRQLAFQFVELIADHHQPNEPADPARRSEPADRPEPVSSARPAHPSAEGRAEARHATSIERIMARLEQVGEAHQLRAVARSLLNWALFRARSARRLDVSPLIEFGSYAELMPHWPAHSPVQQARNRLFMAQLHREAARSNLQLVLLDTDRLALSPLSRADCSFTCRHGPPASGLACHCGSGSGPARP